VIDKSGNFVVKPNIDVASVERGIVIYRNNLRYGAKELKSQKDIVPAEYDNIELVGDLLRLTNRGATYGYINKSGNYVIDPQYEMAWDFKNGKAIVQQKNNYLYIDKSGRVLGNVPTELQPYYYANANTLYATSDNGKFGFSQVDKEGFVIEPSYDFATDFEGKIARVNIGASLNEEQWAYQGGKWGLIDASGKQILPSTYELIMPFRNDVAMVNVGGEASYGMCEGDCIESVYYTCEGGKWGLINSKGEVIAEAKYSSLIPFGKNFLAAGDSTFAVIDNKGNELHPAEISIDRTNEDGTMEDFSDINFLKASRGGKVGIVDANGKWVVEPLYEDVMMNVSESSVYKDGILLAKTEGLFRWLCGDKKGRRVGIHR
jgi:hypothetical protein